MLFRFFFILNFLCRTSLSESYQVSDKSFNQFWNIQHVLTDSFKCFCQPYSKEDYVGKKSTIFMEVSDLYHFIK